MTWFSEYRDKERATKGPFNPYNQEQIGIKFPKFAQYTGQSQKNWIPWKVNFALKPLQWLTEVKGWSIIILYVYLKSTQTTVDICMYMHVCILNHFLYAAMVC